MILDAVNIVDQIINNAINMGVSDIHFEPLEINNTFSLRVRYRIDGVLHDQDLSSFGNIDYKLSQQILSRIKVLANIDISLKKTPQDGKFSHNSLKNKKSNNKINIDLRVSTFPSSKGEKIVIRILDRNLQPLKLSELGLNKDILHSFNRLIGKPSGFLLVTGPTGSGKTTTLYAALENLHTPDKNIITLEDPIEYNLPGITQGQINNETGFTFAKGIRSLLRQDPDIVMIGEIRDRESAKIAIEAALAGRTVFSTLHTNNTAGAIMRLVDMGVEPFLINAALTGVLAQRLVRKLCLNCKFEYSPSVDELAFMKKYNFSNNKLYKSRGCDKCNNTGAKGRTGIFELLLVTDELRELISSKPKLTDLEAQAVKDGTEVLLLDAINKIKSGEISLPELIRVIA